jgi:hypothetical protein
MLRVISSLGVDRSVTHCPPQAGIFPPRGVTLIVRTSFAAFHGKNLSGKK